MAGKDWRATGHRLILPTYNAMGSLSGCRARYIGEGRPQPKELATCGGVRGVFADSLARAILSGSICTPASVIVAEGGPDFLTWATLYGAADDAAPAVIGLCAGAWTDEIAARIPDGSRLLLRVHADLAGAHYAATVLKTLIGRSVVVVGQQEAL